jgi:hypothetical protein
LAATFLAGAAFLAATFFAGAAFFVANFLAGAFFAVAMVDFLLEVFVLSPWRYRSRASRILIENQVLSK